MEVRTSKFDRDESSAHWRTPLQVILTTLPGSTQPPQGQGAGGDFEGKSAADHFNPHATIPSLIGVSPVAGERHHTWPRTLDAHPPTLR